MKRVLLLPVLIGAGFFGAAKADEFAVNHSECSFFGPEREKFAAPTVERGRATRLTEHVMRQIGTMSVRADGAAAAPSGSDDRANSGNLIDGYIFGALQSAGVQGAPRTTDYEFIRRVSLDLTGRIPTPDRVQAFVADTRVNKRSALVDELLGKPEWIDKWTMYYGDKFKNASNKTFVRMYDPGRDAFYNWIKDSLTSHKPYNQMVKEIISAKGDNSYDNAQGAINWLVGGRVVNGPQQDIWDQQAANISETFLGLANVNCILCHNGRGHLDTINLWGSQTARQQAWQISAFLSHSNEMATPVDPMVPNGNRYWSIVDDVRPYNTDYALNTTTGNRPARQPVGNNRAMAPVYFFTGDAPKSGENYRDALARMVTGDFQFARATVNYLWEQFFNRGIVTPSNQFDLARLDPANPPPDPWTLQPSNPALLKALAQDFIDHGYDIRYLMKVITTSEAYQMSARYNGTWDPSYEPLFARHYVRRLWGEEVMDGVAQTSNLPTTYTVSGNKFNWAMQSPEPRAIQNVVLASFLPGNRDDQERKSDGAVQQGLSMMNDPIIMNRTRATGSGAAASLAAKLLLLQPSDLVDTLYLTVLSRPATDDEKKTALAYLGTGTRQQKIEDLVWALYNKVDFLYNY